MTNDTSSRRFGLHAWRTVRPSVRVLLTALVVASFAGCGDAGDDDPAETAAADRPPAVLEKRPSDSDAPALAERAKSIFGPLPAHVGNPANPFTPAKIDLGRMLYYETRLSKNHDIACNSCHQLDRFGVDNEPTSPGHRGQRGERNSPTVYNAALHATQFWDGREPDVEAQAKGPILNPVEMASASEAEVIALLKSIPGYVEAFAAAFPGEADPVTYDNLARAIGAFERKLMTPGRFDAFMEGDHAALEAQELRGLETFLAVGCATCHMGPAVGGTLFRKLGFIYPFATNDKGRENLTDNRADRHVFKVPGLRNVVETGPWFHDGSQTELAEVVRIMGYHQLGQSLDDQQIEDIVAFLGSLTGRIDAEYVAKPTLPPSGPETPAPDPS